MKKTTLFLFAFILISTLNAQITLSVDTVFYQEPATIWTYEVYKVDSNTYIVQSTYLGYEGTIHKTTAQDYEVRIITAGTEPTDITDAIYFNRVYLASNDERFYFKKYQKFIKRL
jgi:hydrogenase maturation factor